MKSGPYILDPRKSDFGAIAGKPNKSTEAMGSQSNAIKTSRKHGALIRRMRRIQDLVRQFRNLWTTCELEPEGWRHEQSLPK